MTTASREEQPGTACPTGSDAREKLEKAAAHRGPAEPRDPGAQGKAERGRGERPAAQAAAGAVPEAAEESKQKDEDDEEEEDEGRGHRAAHAALEAERRARVTGRGGAGGRALAGAVSPGDQGELLLTRGSCGAGHWNRCFSPHSAWWETSHLTASGSL